MTIAKVSWIRLSSVTHSCNQNQSLIFLLFTQAATKLTIQAPANSNIAHPGHYMLFVLNKRAFLRLDISRTSRRKLRRRQSTLPPLHCSNPPRHKPSILSQWTSRLQPHILNPPVVVGVSLKLPLWRLLGGCIRCAEGTDNV